MKNLQRIFSVTILLLPFGLGASYCPGRINDHGITYERVVDVENWLAGCRDLYALSYSTRARNTLSMHEVNKQFGIPFTPEDLKRYFDAAFKLPDFKRGVLVLFIARGAVDELLGVLIMKVVDASAGNYELGIVFVRPDMWKRKIATKLYEYMGYYMSKTVSRLQNIVSKVRLSNAPFTTFLTRLVFQTDVAATDTLIKATDASTAPDFVKAVTHADALVKRWVVHS